MPGKGLFDNPPENTTILDSDRLASWKQASPSAVNYLLPTRLRTWVRSLFSAGSNVAIDSNGVISATAGETVNVAGGTATIVNTIAELKALTGLANNTIVRVRGYHAANDGGGGTFYYLSGSSATADNGYIFQPNNNVGRFFRKIRELQRVNVLYFGAKANDFSFDNLSAFNAATTFAITNGWDILIPSGVYRITGRWLLGNLYSIESQGILELYTADGARDIDSTLFNNSIGMINGKKRPSIIGSGNPVIYGDFTPGAYTAIVAYCLPGTSNHNGCGVGVYIDGITIAGKNAYSGGTLVQFANYTNLQCGLYVPFGIELSILNCCFRSVHFGCFGFEAYWTTWRNCIAWKCGVGFQSWTHNAATWEDLAAWYCDTGYKISFQNATTKNLSTYNCVQDIWLGDFLNGTLEGGIIDSPNSSDYAIRIGSKPGSNGALNGNFIGISMTARTGTKGFIINAGTFITLIGCTSNGMPIEIASGLSPLIAQICSNFTYTGAGSSSNCRNLTP